MAEGGPRAVGWPGPVSLEMLGATRVIGLTQQVSSGWMGAFGESAIERSSGPQNLSWVRVIMGE